MSALAWATVAASTPPPGAPHRVGAVTAASTGARAGWATTPKRDIEEPSAQLRRTWRGATAAVTAATAVATWVGGRPRRRQAGRRRREGGGSTFGFWSVRQAVKVLGGARRGAATRSCACG